MWFRRPEFDRYATFKCDAAIRGGYDWEALCETLIPVPSPTKQKEIVNEYNTIINRINLNKQLIQKLEETAQAIYKQWFVDFEFPDENGKPYKSSGGEMVESELGEIPKGWESKPFTKIIKLTGGGTPDTKNLDYWNGEIPFFTPADVVDSYYSIVTEKYISNVGLKKSSTRLYPFNTIFVTARGTVGGVSISGSEMAMNQSCYAITGRNDINPYFTHQLTLSTIFKLKNEAVGAVFAALVTKDFDSQILIEPDLNTIKLFGLKVKTIYDYTLTKVQENYKLMDLKNLLLSKLATIEI
jgi:type I restriction enzyme S subunit